jgi:hypothetical protein
LATWPARQQKGALESARLLLLSQAILNLAVQLAA